MLRLTKLDEQPVRTHSLTAIYVTGLLRCIPLANENAGYRHPRGRYRRRQAQLIALIA